MGDRKQVREQARAVLDAMRTRPSLMYEVLRQAMGGPPVLGPWEAGEEDLWLRRGTTGNVYATVRVSWPFGFSWMVKGASDAYTEGTVEQARDGCDRWLLNHGFLLAPQEEGDEL